MGTHDELCIVCGIAPGSHPQTLRVRSARDLKTELYGVYKSVLPAGVDISILDDAIKILSVRQPTRPDWLPEVIWANEPAFDECVAIGRWDDDGRQVVDNVFRKDSGEDDSSDTDSIRHVVPPSKGVQTRLVSEGDRGRFANLYNFADRKWHKEATDCLAGGDMSLSPCFFVSACCFAFLRAWIDFDSLPTQEGDSLEFAEELYDMVNSLPEQRVFYQGHLPCINYGGILETLDQWQDYFSPRTTTRHVQKAIESGLRGEDLLLPLLWDHSGWAFARPDVWPSPSLDGLQWPTTYTEKFPSSPHSPSASSVLTLPSDLILAITLHLSPRSYLNLAATCSRLHSFLMSKEISNSHFRQQVLYLSGELHWILPVPNPDSFLLTSEKPDVVEWLRLALYQEDKDAGASTNSTRGDFDLGNAFLHQAFPYTPFVRACFESLSMCNRRRIHGQVKQFEKMWTAYRLGQIATFTGAAGHKA